MTKRDPKPYVVERADQRQALSSAIRLEILGYFTSPGGSSIAEIAERMGRPASALYYHFGILERVGLLVRAGTRPAGKRQEALFEMVASRIEIAVESDSTVAVEAALKTVSSAFRMAERDMEAALADGTARQEGDDRNCFAARMHCRVSKKTLADLNEHLNAIYQIAERDCQGDEIPADADEYCSITLALLPLRGRKQPDPNP